MTVLGYRFQVTGSSYHLGLESHGHLTDANFGETISLELRTRTRGCTSTRGSAG